ncbi:hypothetical protein [Fusobacterium necrophorum]|uniref:hypothetical protein n=1 Tax=Fusobacterium necrophorum TaxID=859 RepID=UPI00370E195F
MLQKRKSNTKEFKKRSQIVYIDGKNGLPFDNIFTLIRSNKDELLGLAEILFYSIINTDPITYYNMVKNDLTEEEIDECCNDYKNYLDYYKNLKKYTKEEVDDVIKFIRNEAINEQAIVVFCRVSDKEVIYEPQYKFDMKYIAKKILKYYNEKKKEDVKR